MSALMIVIRCPKMGRAIPTGIETDESSFKRIPDVLSRTRCLACGCDHVWWKRETWLADALPDNSRQKTAA